MNIIKYELKASMKSLIIWCISMIFFSVLGITEFSAFEGSDMAIQFMDTLPETMINLFGFNYDFSTITGFTAVMLPYYILALSIFSAMGACTIIIKEERDKTADFALVMPITREKLLTYKILTVVISSLILNIITILGIIISVARYNPSPEYMQFIMISSVAMFIIQCVFIALGMLLATAIKKFDKAQYINLGIVMGAYFISLMVNISKVFQAIRFLSPIAYFSTESLIDLKLDIPYLIVSAIIIIICSILSFKIYKKKDIC